MLAVDYCHPELLVIVTEMEYQAGWFSVVSFLHDSRPDTTVEAPLCCVGKHIIAPRV